MQIRNVIFDLDGTLLDTGEGIMESAAYAIRETGLAPLPEATLARFAGPPVQESFMRHCGLDAEAAQKAADLFREHYSAKALLKARPYDGIYELCGSLRRNAVGMAVATYKREDYALRLLRRFGFGRYFRSMHGGDSENRRKKADIVRMCMGELGGTAADTVLVGDTEYDALGAQEAGIPFIAVAYGFGFRSEADLESYPHMGVARKPKELLNLVLGGKCSQEVV